jgi:hypothetical protein
MSHLLTLRLEDAIAAEQNIIQRLLRSSSQVHRDILYVNSLSAYSNSGAGCASSLLCTLTLLKEPTTPALVSTLLELPMEEILTHLQTFVDEQLLVIERPLNSITSITAIRVRHGSLHEFVVGSLQRGLDDHLVDPAETHSTLLARCLQLLHTLLRQDICDIRDPGCANVDVLDLPARIAHALPEAVLYACRSWPAHLIGSGTISERMSSELLNFCTQHLLHWIEVMSLLGELSSAGQYLLETREWCKVCCPRFRKSHLIDAHSAISRMCLRPKRFQYS